MQKLIFNGKLKDITAKIAGAGNRGLRYGDGLFETMKLINGEVNLQNYHFDRLFSGLEMLQFPIPRLFTAENLVKQIKQLSEINQCSSSARIRLMVFRGDGGLYEVSETGFNYVIQCWPMQEITPELNVNGVILGVYPAARKGSDVFANLKTANFLPYVMASLYARQNKWNDCLVLNQYGRVADSTIANLFYVKDDRIVTPPLSEACVAGILRRYLLEQLARNGYDIQEEEIHPEQLAGADELFLTNSIYGIRWVKELEGVTYRQTLTASLFERFILPFYSGISNI